MLHHWHRLIVLSVLCLGEVSGFVQTAFAERTAYPIEWDVLPNGLMMLSHDHSDDGVPDYFTLHPITWSGWTTQSPDELEAQACADRQWVFIVEYDQDRYAYFAQPIPLFDGEDTLQTGQWSANLAHIPPALFSRSEDCTHRQEGRSVERR